ncbi:alanine racemase [bacterium]|nr:alanine racemase [bacterium]
MEIDLSKIRQNIRIHKSMLKSDDSILAVVKADGYGHGSVPVLKAALEEGVVWAGISSVEEAIILRNAGIEVPILLLGGWYPEAIPAFFCYSITPSLYSIELAKKLNEYAKSINTPIKVHVKLETGMGRLGFTKDQLNDFINAKNELDYLVIDGVYSHLSSADESDTTFSEEQSVKFHQMVHMLKENFPINWIHIANSAGISQLSSDRGNLFRLGISMYGQAPAPNLTKPLNLSEAITWKSSICHLQWFPPNYPIGYGRTYCTDKKTLIGTVAVGYADGYSRSLSNVSQVLVHGKRAPVVGTICMDMLMIDVSNIEDVEAFDEVVLIGKQGEDKISATEMANWINTINYEITCNISSRVPRKYIN